MKIDEKMNFEESYNSEWMVRNNTQQFTNVTDLDAWATANGLEGDEAVNLRRLELMCEAIDQPQLPEPVESTAENKDQWVDDWFQEVQNQPEPTASQMDSLANEFDIFQQPPTTQDNNQWLDDWIHQPKDWYQQAENQTELSAQDFQSLAEEFEVMQSQPSTVLQTQIQLEEVERTDVEMDRMCDICSKVLSRKRDIPRHKRLVHKIEPSKIESVKRKMDPPSTSNKKLKMGVCNWCKQTKDLQDKPYCQRCGEQGKECTTCHRPLPQKFFNQSQEKCDACSKKQQTGGAQTALQGVVSTTTLQPEQKWDLLKMFSEEEGNIKDNLAEDLKIRGGIK